MYAINDQFKTYLRSTSNTKRNSLLINILLCFCILSSCLKLYGIPIFGSIVSLFRVFSTITFIGILVIFAFQNIRIYFDKYDKLLFFIIICTFAQFVFLPGNLMLSHGIYEIVDFSLVLLFLICQKHFSINYRLLLLSLLVALLIPVLLGFYQSVFYIFKGEVPNLPFQQFYDKIEHDNTYNVYERICSCFHDPSYFAAVLGISVVLSLGLLFFYKGSGKKIIKLLSFTLLGLSILPLILTLSGTGLFATISGVFLLLLFSANRKSLLKFLVFFSLGFILIVIFLHYANIDFINILLFKLSNQINNSGGIFYSRRPFYEVGFNSFLSSPIFGVGIGNLQLVGHSTQSSAHFSLLTIAAEQGLICFVPTFILLVVLPIKDLINLRKCSHSNYPICLVLYISFATVLIQSFGYDLLYKIDFVFCLFLAFILFIRKPLDAR